MWRLNTGRIRPAHPVDQRVDQTMMPDYKQTPRVGNRASGSDQAVGVGDTSALLLLRLFLIAGWSRSLLAKAISPAWWDGSTVDEFVADHDGAAVGPYRLVMDQVAANPSAIALVVFVAELVVVALLVRRSTVVLGAAVGSVLNVAFVLAGAVNPSAFYLIIQAALILSTSHGRAPSVDHPKEWLNVLAPATLRARRALLLLALVVIGLVLVAAGRTFDPEEVKADPALMLALLAFLVAAGLIARLSTEPTPAEPQGRLLQPEPLEEPERSHSDDEGRGHASDLPQEYAGDRRREKASIGLDDSSKTLVTHNGRTENGGKGSRSHISQGPLDLRGQSTIAPESDERGPHQVRHHTGEKQGEPNVHVGSNAEADSAGESRSVHHSAAAPAITPHRMPNNTPDPRGKS